MEGFLKEQLRQRVSLFAAALVLAVPIACSSEPDTQDAAPDAQVSVPEQPVPSDVISTPNPKWARCQGAVVGPLVRITSFIGLGDDASAKKEQAAAEASLGKKSPEAKLLGKALGIYNAATAADEEDPAQLSQNAVWIFCEDEYGKSGLPNPPDPEPIEALSK